MKGLAHQLAVDLGDYEVIEGTAINIAVVETITSRNFVVAMETSQDGGMDCVGFQTDEGSTAVCGQASLGDLANGIGSWSTDGVWAATLVYGPDGTNRIVAFAEDGTSYAIQTHDQWGFVEWPVVRGEISEWVAYDVNGEEIP